MATKRVAMPDRLLETVKSFIVSEQLIRNGSLVLAAVSGGADSMAMLSILHALGPELDFQLAVGHFNHRLRDSADADEERAIVEDTARSLGHSFYYGEADVRAAVAETGDSLEEAARKARYGFLAEIAERTGAAHIATGHTRDDQAETVLMRILRGAGIRGLAGIPVRRGRGSIIRPVLPLERRNTRAYCETRGVPFADDASNQDRRFLRNRIRLELLPLLESEYHPGVTDNLIRLSQNAATIIRAIRARTDPLIERAVRKDSEGTWVVDLAVTGFPVMASAAADLETIDPVDDTSFIVFFGDLFAETLGCDADLTRAHYEQLIRLVTDPLASGKMVSLPRHTVKREYDTLRIVRSQRTADTGFAHRTNRPHWAPVVVAVPGHTRAPGLLVTTEILDRTGISNRDLKSIDDEAYFDLQRIAPPLTLRKPSPGDRMQPFGLSGTKKLSDIFIDKKIPASRRAGLPIISDSKDILWIVGVATSEKTRVGDRTEKVVKISIEKT